MNAHKRKIMPWCAVWRSDARRVYLAYLLLAQILATEGILQTLSNLLSRDCFQIGRFEDIIDDGGIALELFRSHCHAI